MTKPHEYTDDEPSYTEVLWHVAERCNHYARRLDPDAPADEFTRSIAHLHELGCELTSLAHRIAHEHDVDLHM